MLTAVSKLGIRHLTHLVWFGSRCSRFSSDDDRFHLDSLTKLFRAVLVVENVSERPQQILNPAEVVPQEVLKLELSKESLLVRPKRAIGALQLLCLDVDDGRFHVDFAFR